MADNRNMFLAVGLSLAVIIIWQFFFIEPQMEAQREAQRQAEIAAQQNPDASAPRATPASPSSSLVPNVPAAGGSAAPSPAAPGATATGEEAAASARIPIDTPSVDGSIRLVGARLDDLKLKDYRVTVDPQSPEVRLLSPTGTELPYFAETGWIASEGVAKPDSNTVWTLESGETLTPSTPITLAYDTGEGLVYRRTIEVDDHYMFTVHQSVENNTDAEVTLYPYSRVRRVGLDDLAGFFILHEGYIGVIGDEGLVQEGYNGLEDDKIRTLPAATGGWLGMTDKYWATAVIPEPGTTFNGRYVYDVSQGKPTYQADYYGEAVTVAPGAKGEAVNRVFAGAKEYSIINSYDKTIGIDRFNLLIDWGWFYFITKPMFLLIDFIYGLVGNFGLAILGATVVVKLIFFPLAQKAYKSMARMKALQPEMVKMRERFKDDKMKQQQAMMELYKKEKVNPLAGCIPILIQIPVFFALYKTLFVSIEMRHAPFFGWIDDLSAPDPTTIFNLFGLIPWDPTTVPLIGSFLALGIWPIIMGITMWVQMKMNPAPPDPTQAMIFNWMPVFFTFLLASFPAGLVIYWAWNNTLSVLQQYVIMRREGVKVELWDNLSGIFKRSKKPKKSAT